MFMNLTFFPGRGGEPIEPAAARLSFFWFYNILSRLG
jgi:hypothetical protein